MGKSKADGRKDHKRVTSQVVEDAMDWIASGKTLSEFCRESGRPTRRAILYAVEKSPELCARFAVARSVGHDELAEEVLRLVDEELPVDRFGHVDGGLVSQRKLQADVRLRLLAKWDSGRYGDRLHVSGGVQVTVVAPIVREIAAAEPVKVTSDGNGKANRLTE